MSRSSAMTIGFLLLFTGIQLSMVESYVLTPRASKFWAEKLNSSNGLFQTVYQDGYAPTNRAVIPGQQFVQQQTQQQLQQSPFANNAYQNGYGGSPFQNAGYNPAYAPNGAPAVGNLSARTIASATGLYQPKRIIPPEWLCWPAICLGAVLFLYGAAFKRH